MDIHKNARLTPKGREEMVRTVVDGGLSKAAAARRFNTTAKTVAKWVERFRAQGVEGLRDRSSKPVLSPGQTPAATCATVEALRRQPYTGKQIALYRFGRPDRHDSNRRRLSSISSIRSNKIFVLSITCSWFPGQRN